MKPSLCRNVIYRSRTGDYSLAAMVIGTIDSLNPLGVERGQVPPITADTNVHLVVFTPGLPPWDTPGRTTSIIDPSRELGDRIIQDTEGTARPTVLGEGQFLGMTAFGGTYAEFDIPFSPVATVGETSTVTDLADGDTWGNAAAFPQEPGTWAWPPR